MTKNFSIKPSSVIKTDNHPIHCFEGLADENIDPEVVQSFGDEWSKFHSFDEKDLEIAGSNYFKIVSESVCNKSTYGIDLGCGTGRWSKYLSQRIGFMECLDPSDAIYAANRVLNDTPNVRLIKASIDNIPFPDNTFDFAMSVGVLHHIPNTLDAMKNCVAKVKPGGYVYTYLYYNLEDRGVIFKTVFKISDGLRKIISRLSPKPKKFACDFLAIAIYWPLVSLARIFSILGMKKIAKKIPLSSYMNKTFYIMRNDSLDRFGTKLEQRFSRQEITDMMTASGLKNVQISSDRPYYTALGQKI